VSAAVGCFSNDAEVMDPLDEADDPAQIITRLDNIVVQLQKHAEQLEAHHLDDATASIAVPATTTTPAKSAQVQDVCDYSHQAKPICVAGGRHTDWKVCKTALPALLAGCAVFAQKLVHQGSYTSGYRQHSNHFLVADTNQQVTLKQMEQMMDALTSSPCMSDNVSKHKGLMLLLIACLQ